MINRPLSNLSNHLIFFIPPVFYLLPGVLLSQKYTGINLLPLLIMYIFVLINRSLESFLSYSKIKPYPKIIALELANIVMIFFFYINTSFFLGNLFLAYSLLIHLQYSFKKYQLHYFAIVLLVVFKLFLLNGISFYISAQFISSSYLLWVFPLFAPFLLVELDRWKINTPIMKISLLFISFAIGLTILWSIVGYWSLLLLFALPSSYYALKWNNYIGSIFFTIGFSIISYLILFLFS